MKLHDTKLKIIVALIGAGLIGSAAATPKESQRLRGLEGRVFLVTVELTKDEFSIFVPVGTTFPNCYNFDDEGFSETAFPTTGAWSQDSNGAKTSYSVGNAFGFEQLGDVTPAGGNGVLQLEAVSTIAAAGLEFVSVGQEIQGSDILDCPTFPMFTFPESDEPN